MSEMGVCEQSSVQAVFSGEQCSAILCISLTSLALNGARTRGRGLGGPSMMDDTAESSDGQCYPTWVSSKEMFLQVCSCSLPSPLQPSVVAFWHHRFSLKQDSKLCICEYSFITQCTLLGFKNNQVFLSDPLKFASDIF